MIISPERRNVIFCSYFNASYNYVAFLSFRKLCGNVCYCSRLLKITGIFIIFDGWEAERTHTCQHIQCAWAALNPSPLVILVITIALETDTRLIILILQMRHLKNDEVKQLARSHKAKRRQRWDLNQAVWLYALNHCLSKHHPSHHGPSLKFSVRKRRCWTPPKNKKEL